MEIVSVCAISAVLRVVKLVMLAVIVLHPEASALSLGIGVNECFERVSIGKRLNRGDVSRSVANTTLRQCDVACERETCNAYAYGIGPTGNGTCELSIPLPKYPPDEDPDYDLFIRVLQCRNMTMCFSRLVTGRRIIDRYVRRTFPCDSLARCQLACSIEREFICEGFNYRFGTSPDLSNSCQLTAMPGMNLDLTLDFISDVDYDFYSRDRNAPAACGFISYKTWDYGYTPRTTPVPQDQWWLRPTQVPDEYAVGLQPRVDLNEIYNNRWNNHGYECFVRARTGFRLHRQTIIMTLNAPTLYDCEFVCANERKFKCNILSYRYSSTPMTDNCQLGEKTIRQLEFYYDLVPDRDYDVYIRNEFSQPSCQPTRTWDSDCFERTRTGVRIDPSLVRFAVNTDTLIDCELICLHIRHFTCRAFSFRYGPKLASGTYNCLLTDHPVPEMDPRKHFVDDGSCELYHRGSYGHGCEIDRWPYSGSPNFTPVNRKDWYPPTTLQPPAINPTVVTVTSSSYPYNPTGKDYGNQGPTTSPIPYDPGLFFPSTGKPYLPPSRGYPSGPRFRPQKPILPASPTIPPRDRPQIPWSSNTPGGAFGTRKLDKICYIAYGAPARLKPAAVAKSLLVVSEHECKAECSRSREMSKFRCATISYWSGHCELSDIELRDLKPNYDYAPHDSYWLFSWDFTNPRCYNNPAMQPPADGVWSSYTVSGRRCKWGSQCSLWKEAGVWTCQVEGGDWDYCCRPDHHCGFSEGYPYPWCYVGSVREQWRPCNERYYPYQEHKRGAPHWPISYVHKQGPPNSTARFDHQPSIVDNFLASLQFDKDRVSNGAPKSGAVRSAYGHTNSSSMLEFQVVDIPENVGNVSSASSTPAPARSTTTSVKIIEPGKTDKLKRSPAKETPNIT